MPITITMKTPIHGIAMECAFKGEPATVAASGFYSTEDGSDFTFFLESLGDHFLSGLSQSETHRSQIDHLMVIIRKDQTATIYCNELSAQIQILPKRDKKTGDAVFEDDIVDIQELTWMTIGGTAVEIPSDCGVVLIFSVGWRKGLFFDFRALPNNSTHELSDLPRLFGQLYAQVQFQEKFRISELQWSRLFEWGWFPFCCLGKKELRTLVTWSKQDRYPEDTLTEICTTYKKQLEQRVQVWEAKSHFNEHMPFIKAAYTHYMRDEYIASIQVIMPRIEGIMREYSIKESPGSKIGQATMVADLVNNKEVTSLQLPLKFKQYMLNCYFKGFNVEKGEIPLSRHSVGHGVSKAADYTFIEATLPFMIVDEIFFFLP